MNQNVYGHQDSEAIHANNKYYDEVNKTASSYYGNENSVQHQDKHYKTLKCLKKTSKNSMTENEQTKEFSGQGNSSDEPKQKEDQDFFLQGCGSPIIRFTDEPYIKNSEKNVLTENKQDERVPTCGDNVLLNVIAEREPTVLQSSITCGNI